MKQFPYRKPGKRDEEPPPPADVPVRGTLGSLRSHHGLEPFKRARILLTFTALFWLAAIGSSSEAYARASLIIVGACPLLAAATDAFVLRARGLVDLHANGLVIHKLRRRIEVLFDDVDELWLASTIALREVRLKRLDGSTVRVPLALQESQRLLDAIVLRCSAHLAPEAERALAAGEALTFGKVRLSPVGLWQNKKLVNWADVASVLVTSKAVVLERSKWPRTLARIPLRAVPHPQLFVHLVNKLANIEVRDPSRQIPRSPK